MKKIKVLVFALIVFLLGINITYAVCSSEEQNNLNSLAVNVKANYEIKYEEIKLAPGDNYPEGLTPEERENYRYKNYYFNIYITNLIEELYVTVYDSVSRETTKYTYNDSENGVITIRQDDRNNLRNYTIKVYSSDKTNCKDKVLYTIYLSLPRYNSLSEFEVCDDIPEYYLCHEYVTFDEATADDFLGKVEKYIADKNKGDNSNDQNDNDKNLFEEYKVPIIIGVVVIIIGGVATVIIVKRQRSRIV